MMLKFKDLFAKVYIVRRYRHFVAVIAFLLILAVGAELLGLKEHFSIEQMQQSLAANTFSGVLLFVLLFSAGNLIQIPGWIFLGAAVFAFGRINGGLITYLAAITSCTFTFFTIRLIGGDAMCSLKSKVAVRLLTELHAHPIRNIAALRSIFQTLPALNYALALSGISYRKYLLGTLLGLPLPIAAYCLFFDYLMAFHRH